MNDIQLTATLPSEMVQSQQVLVDWMTKKIELVSIEAQELQEAYEHAKKQSWKYKVLQRHANLAAKRVQYYVKIKAALEAGFYIVPNFPVELFAVRTERDRPLKMLDTSNWGRKQQGPSEAVIGEGEYKNPQPVIMERTWTGGDGKEHIEYWADEWQGIEFPITMAKPRIMEVTAEAMSKKIFDQIGIMPGVKKDEDPVIIGQIVHKISQYSRRTVSFMLAWHLNTNVL